MSQTPGRTQGQSQTQTHSPSPSRRSSISTRSRSQLLANLTKETKSKPKSTSKLTQAQTRGRQGQGQEVYGEDKDQEREEEEEEAWEDEEVVAHFRDGMFVSSRPLAPPSATAFIPSSSPRKRATATRRGSSGNRGGVGVGIGIGGSSANGSGRASPSKRDIRAPRRRESGLTSTTASVEEYDSYTNDKQKPTITNSTTEDGNEPQVQLLPPLAQIHTQTIHLIHFLISYSISIITNTIHLLRYPLVLFSFLWALAILMLYLQSTISRAMRGSICWAPFISSSSFCSLQGGQPRIIADYPSLIQTQSSSFSTLLSDSPNTQTLSIEMKKVEMASKDLVVLVRSSTLPSKDVLANHLSAFVLEARKTGEGLSKFDAKLRGSVESVEAVNDWALEAISNAAKEEEVASQKANSSLRRFVPVFLGGGVIVGSKENTARVISKTFTEAMSVLSAHLERLITSAEYNLHSLDALEEQLNVLHEILSRDATTISESQEEVLSKLWTSLGGNKGELRILREKGELLGRLGMYRRQALLRVVSALEMLRRMRDDVEELRERALTPQLVGVGSGGEVPVEVHMKAIRAGIERLKEGREKAKRLEEDVVQRIFQID